MKGTSGSMAAACWKKANCLNVGIPRPAFVNFEYLVGCVRSWPVSGVSSSSRSPCTPCSSTRPPRSAAGACAERRKHAATVRAYRPCRIHEPRAASRRPPCETVVGKPMSISRRSLSVEDGEAHRSGGGASWAAERWEERARALAPCRRPRSASVPGGDATRRVEVVPRNALDVKLSSAPSELGLRGTVAGAGAGGPVRTSWTAHPGNTRSACASASMRKSSWRPRRSGPERSGEG
mmetsp:Transcript_2102/g.6603  ORF Transcript_2102/g.6603 Transcript_2102/m.6603 type:complete len:236 (+) Transcript_2102:222-929(+)